MKIAIHCPTEEEYNKLIEHYKTKGWRNFDGEEHPEYDPRRDYCLYWDEYSRRRDLWQEENYTILTYEEMLEYEKTGELPSQEEPREPKTWEWIEVSYDGKDRHRSMFAFMWQWNYGCIYVGDEWYSTPDVTYRFEARKIEPPELTHKEIEEKIWPFIYKPN